MAELLTVGREAGRRLGGRRRGLPSLFAAMLFACAALAAAQPVAMVPIGERFELASGNAKSSINPQTRLLTSSADIALHNISGGPIAGPLHAVIGLTGQNLATVQAPGALGGLGQAPYQTFYIDLTPQLAATGGSLPTSGTLQFTLVLIRPATVSLSYAVTPFGPGQGSDVDPPQQVALTAPATALAGQQIALTASAIDNVGIGRIEFSQDGHPLGDDASAPYSIQALIPADATPGTVVRFDAEAFDFAGNHAAAPPQFTTVVAAGDGAFEGGVFDATTGLPLAGATIEMLAASEPSSPSIALAAAAPPSASDEQGLFRQGTHEGPVVLRFSKPSFNTVWRVANILPDAVTHIFNPRLTPLAPEMSIDNAFGGTIAAAGGKATLFAPPGTFSGEARVSITALDGQGLPGLLPPGWTPASAWLIGPEALVPNYPLELRVFGAENLGADPAPAGLIAALWNPATLRWVRLEMNAGEAGGALVSLTKPGAVVFALPDAQPSQPPIPDVGQPLEGVAQPAIATGAKIDIEPSPQILFMQPGAHSIVAAALSNGAPLPSGTAIKVAFDESYNRTDGSRLVPPPMLQDFVLYQRAGGFRASFPVTPSRQFDPALLQQGVIQLLASRPGDAVGSALAGTAGGTVHGQDGSAVAIPAGALAGPAPLLLRPIAAPEGLSGQPHFSPLAGIWFDVAGTLSASAVWTFPLAAPLPADAQVLALREVELQGITRYELVGLGEVSGSVVTVGAGGAGLPLPGIRGGGRYFLILMADPAGFVSGAVTRSGGGGPGAGFASIDTLPFVSLFSDSAPHYVLAGLLGAQTIGALGLTDGSIASASPQIASRGQIVAQDLQLGAARPTVVSVAPADGATGASAFSAVRIAFSRAMNPALFIPANVELRAGGSAVDAAVSLQPDGMTAAIQPAAPLANETLYQIHLSAALADTFGALLFGNQPDGSFDAFFTTANTAPPPRPDPGQISMTLPDDDGVVTLTGSLGSAPPGAVVTIVNATTGGASSVLAGADGSFTLRFVASIDDVLTVELRDSAGNTTTFSPGLFNGGDGNVVVGPAGGTVTLADGSTFTFEEGAFANASKVTIEPFGADQNPIPPLDGAQLEFAAGLRIDTHGQELLKPLHFRLKHPDPLPTDRPLLVARLDEINGEKTLVLIESAKYIDGAIQVNSPPFPGVFGYLAASGPIVVFVPALLSNISFVTGKVIKAPPVGVLSVNVEKEVEIGGAVSLFAQASAIPPGASVQSVKITREDGTSLVSGAGPTVGVADTVATGLISTVGSWVKFILLGQQKETWLAEAQILANNKTFTLKTSVASEILTAGTPSTERRTGVTHEFDRVTEGASEPAVGAFIEVFNGLATSYPIVTQTNKLGKFVLAVSTGTGILHVFDPLTGQGVQFPINVPTTVFDFLDVGDLFVPKSFGDGLPPTLDVSVNGSLTEGQPFTVTLNATDNDALERIGVKINDDSVFSKFPIANPYSESFQFTPPLHGDYTIEAQVFDNSGNSSVRKVLVHVPDPAAASVNVSANVGSASIQNGTKGLPSRFGAFIPLASLPANLPEGCLALEDMTNLNVAFVDKISGQRIPATGGLTAANPLAANAGLSVPDSQKPMLFVEPLYPLPPNSDYELDVNGSKIDVSTGGLVRGKVLSGFTQIRGLAQWGRYVYVADFTETGDSVRIVDIGNPDNPKIVGGMPFPGGARGVSVDLGRLAVVGGGGSSLPVLRVYDLTDPLNPARTGNCVLFPLAEQAIPTAVRLSGDVAYVCTIGAGVQSIDLQHLKQINDTPFNQRSAEDQTGASAIIGGFRLPDPEPDPPLVGSPFDVDFNLSGLALTGGSSARLYVLANTVGGFLAPILRPSGQKWFDLPFGMQRVAASPDFIVRGDFNNDGKPDFANMNIAVVSHGASGISVLDLTNPAEPKLLGHIDSGDPIFDMKILEGFVFTSNRVATIFDPASPALSNALSLPDAAATKFSAGADVSISEAFPISGADERLVLMASSDASRAKLQVGMLPIPGRNRDWDIIRTAPLEPRIHPDNLDYLNSGDPINPANGEFVETANDMAVEGRGMDFEFVRTYRSRNSFDGPIGFGWDHTYNDRLTVTPVTNLASGDLGVLFRGGGASFSALSYGDAVRYDGTGRVETFKKGSGSGGYTAPKGVFAELKQLNDTDGDYFELESAEGTKTTYRPSALAPWTHFRLDKIEDRFGNIMRFKYNARDQLTTIRDTMGRDYHLAYDSRGRIAVLTDYAGRQVRYTYDGAGNLCHVTTPATTDFPDGVTTHYGYSGGFREFSLTGQPLPTAQLNHNLVSVTDPDDATYLSLEYSTATDPASIDFDRVVKETLGDPAGLTGQPSGGEFQYSYTASDCTTTNREGHQTTRIYDGSGNLLRIEEDVTIGTTVQNLKTIMTYDGDGQMLTHTSPRGVLTEYTYSPGADRKRQADLTQLKVTPAGGGSPRIWNYKPAAYGTPSQSTDPEGNVTNFTLNTLGLVNQVKYPTAIQADGSTQNVVESFSYGARGELLSATSGSGSVTRYAYFGNADPNGDGDNSETLPAVVDNELVSGPGYLRSITVDANVGGTLASPVAGGPAPANLTNSFKYDPVGNKKETTDPRGIVTTFVYNDQNQLESVGDSRGTRRFKFDGNGSIKHIDDLGGRTLDMKFDSLGRMYQQTESAAGLASRISKFTYDGNENLVGTESPLGYKLTMGYDERQLALQQDTSGGSPNPVAGTLWKMQYDADGNLVKRTNAEGDAWTYDFNGFNELFRETDPNGSKIEYAYDKRGMLIQSTAFDPSGTILRQSTNALDAMGRIRTVTEGVSTGAGSPKQNRATKYIYDGSNRIVRLIDALGREFSTKYDGMSRSISETDADGNETLRDYTGPDPTLVTQRNKLPDGTIQETKTQYKYDLFGRVTKLTEGFGTADARITANTYDGRDNLLSSTQTGGIATVMTYDAFNRQLTRTVGSDVQTATYDTQDRLLTQTDAQGHGLIYEWDGRNRTVSRTYQDSTKESFTYFPDDQMKTMTDRAGNVFAYTYDAANRRTQVDVTAAPGFLGVTQRKYAYDGLNRPVSFTNVSPSGIWTDQHAYNELGLLLSQTEQGASVDASFDLVGDRKTLAYPAGGMAIAEQRSGTGNLTRLDANGAMVMALGYQGRLRPIEAAFGNGTAVARQLNGALEESSRSYLSPAMALQTGFNLSRDGAGRVTAASYLHNGGKGDVFGYTPEGWLASARYDVADPIGAPAGPATSTASWTYDPAGNWNTFTDNGSQRTIFVTPLNQISNDGSANYQYDADGNLTSDGTRNYQYSAYGELMRVSETFGGAELVHYDYDAIGRRVQRTTPAGVERYIYDQDKLILVLDGQGHPIRQYVHTDAADRPAMLRTPAGDFYYQYDYRGSVAALSNGSGDIVERYSYDAWGKTTILSPAGQTLAASAVGNDLTFAGRPLDPATGLIYMRARDYLPALGRFIQPDPQLAVDGLNFYLYAGDDPLNFVDPSGLFRHAIAENMHVGHLAGISIYTGAEIATAVTGLVRSGADLAKSLAKAAEDLDEIVIAIRSMGGLRGRLANAAARVERNWNRFGAFAAKHFPVSGILSKEQRMIGLFAKSRELVIGVRAAKPWTAIGARIANRFLKLGAKPLEIKEKSKFGVLIGKFKNAAIGESQGWLRADYDMAWVYSNKAGRFLTNEEILNDVGGPLNRAFVRAGGKESFMHGAQFSASERVGGELNWKDYGKIGNPGPVQEFGAGGERMIKSADVEAFARGNPSSMPWHPAWDTPTDYAKKFPLPYTPGDVSAEQVKCAVESVDKTLDTLQNIAGPFTVGTFEK